MLNDNFENFNNFENLYVAIHFKKVKSLNNNDYYVTFWPHSAIIGKIIKKNNKKFFKDIFGNYYSNLDIATQLQETECTDIYIKLSELKKLYPKCDLNSLLNVYLNKFKDTFYIRNDDKIVSVNINDYIEHSNSKYIFYNDSKYPYNLLNQLENSENSEYEKYSSYEIDKKTIKKIIKNINSKVFFQEDAIKKLIIQISKSILTSYEKENYIKSNILISGNTGVGKTEIIKQLAKEFNIPFTIEDANLYSPTAYHGNNVEDMLIHLYNEANEDLILAQKGIIVIDEIDKKLGNHYDNSQELNNDFLYSLLKLIEGSNFEIKINNNQEQYIINFDTSKIILILSGSFLKLKNSINKKYIGFNNTENKNDTEYINLIKHFPKEFYGRIFTTVILNDLSEDNLFEILKKSELSPIKKYKFLFEQLDIKIDVDDDLLKRFASIAYKEGSGARGLNKIVSDYFNEILLKNVYSDDLEDQKTLKK